MEGKIDKSKVLDFAFDIHVKPLVILATALEQNLDCVRDTVPAPLYSAIVSTVADKVTEMLNKKKEEAAEFSESVKGCEEVSSILDCLKGQ